MKKSKLTVILYIVIMLFVLIMSVLLTKSYYDKTNKKDEIILKYINLLTTYENGNKINLTSINKGLEQQYKFSVSNSSIDSIGNYKVTLKVITPLSNTIDNNFVYTLESNTTSDDKANVLITKEETPVPISTKDIGSATITPDATHNYTLTIKYNDTKEKVNLKGKIFVCEINIVSE